MRDEQVAQPAFRLKIIEQMKHLILNQHVKRGHRLVTNNDIRVERHGTRDRDTLPLTA